MGTFAASIHLDRTTTRQSALDAALARLEGDLTCTKTRRWLSVHRDDIEFSIEAFPLGRQLSKATGARVVVFALHDSDRSVAEVFLEGQRAASLEAKRRLKWKRTDWIRAGATAEALEGLDDTEADECPLQLAAAFGIPRQTVLLDEGDAPVRSSPKRAAKAAPKAKGAVKSAALATVQMEWEALEAEARAAGVSIPSWEHQLKLNAAFSDQTPATLRAQINQVRSSLPQLAQLVKRSKRR